MNVTGVNIFEVIEYYSQRHSLKETGERFNVCSNTIRNILSSNNIKIRSVSESKSIVRVPDKIWCYACNRYLGFDSFCQTWIDLYNKGVKNTGKCKNCNNNYFQSIRLSAMEKIATFHKKSVICFNCSGSNNLEIAHINSIYGSNAELKEIYKNNYNFHKAILSGRRNISDLGILCSNCNHLYEYEQGYWNINGWGSQLHLKAIKTISEKNNIPIMCEYDGCGIADIRLVTIEHKNKNGHAEMTNVYKGYVQEFYRDIISGKRSTNDLGLLCMNHQKKVNE